VAQLVGLHDARELGDWARQALPALAH
jgi:hypothetical protein